jgi:hypothetical protein
VGRMPLDVPRQQGRLEHFAGMELGKSRLTRERCGESAERLKLTEGGASLCH